MQFRVGRLPYLSCVGLRQEKGFVSLTLFSCTYLLHVPKIQSLCLGRRKTNIVVLPCPFWATVHIGYAKSILARLRTSEVGDKNEIVSLITCSHETLIAVDFSSLQFYADFTM